MVAFTQPGGLRRADELHSRRRLVQPDVENRGIKIRGHRAAEHQAADYCGITAAACCLRRGARPGSQRCAAPRKPGPSYAFRRAAAGHTEAISAFWQNSPAKTVTKSGYGPTRLRMKMRGKPVTGPTKVVIGLPVPVKPPPIGVHVTRSVVNSRV